MNLDFWLPETRQRLVSKMHFAVEKAAQCDFIPYTTRGEEYVPSAIDWWTNGFWGATMWQMYRMTSDAFFRDAAVRAEEMMDEALRHFETLHHDVGFMWLIQSGVRYALEQHEPSRRRTLLCADLLASRFNPNGFIRAWNGDSNQGWAIIDCMMNLSLLYWASRQTGDPRFRLIAEKHADTAVRYFVRPDGSCNHIVIFDPVSGAYLDNPAGQGAVSGSSWSRGQAWAIYGFALSAKNTGKAEYLEVSQRVARYFLSRIEKTAYLPACDLQEGYDTAETRSADGKTEWLQDNAAAAIAACGFLELADQTGDPAWRDAAVRILLALDGSCTDWTESTPAILQRCTSAFHDQAGHHITMNYADYFFIEAVRRLSGEKLCFWAPDLGTDIVLQICQ